MQTLFCALEEKYTWPIKDSAAKLLGKIDGNGKKPGVGFQAPAINDLP
jgi:hypothetical protein